MTDRELADAAWQELTKTTDSYPTWVRKGRLASSHWAKAKTFLDAIGLAAPPPPPAGWMIAPPQAPITNIDATGTSQIPFNLYTASAPMVVQDVVGKNGGDTAILVQPGAPGRTIRRVQWAGVAAGNTVTWGKHFVYGKALGLTVLDVEADGSQYAGSGVSARFPGHLTQRFRLDNFVACLSYYAEDTAAGTVTWKQGSGTFRQFAIELGTDASQIIAPNFIIDDVHATGPGPFLNVYGQLQGSITISNSTLNGHAVTRADCVGAIPAGHLTII